MLRFHWKWSDYELNQARHMRESFRAILETLGGTVNAGRAGGPDGVTLRPRRSARQVASGRTTGPGQAAGGGQATGVGEAAPQTGTLGPARATEQADDRPTLGAGGGIIHEVGCVRMGTDPRSSVVNPFCRVHDVPNVFSADGGPFVSHGDKNPTHTIIALAWRTAEYLAEEMRKGNV